MTNNTPTRLGVLIRNPSRVHVLPPGFPPPASCYPKYPNFFRCQHPIMKKPGIFLISAIPSGQPPLPVVSRPFVLRAAIAAPGWVAFKTVISVGDGLCANAFSGLSITPPLPPVLCTYPRYPKFPVAQFLPCGVVSAGRGTIRLGSQGSVYGRRGPDVANHVALLPGVGLRPRFLHAELPGEASYGRHSVTTMGGSQFASAEGVQAMRETAVARRIGSGRRGSGRRAGNRRGRRGRRGGCGR